jgi:hypothetical protein
MDASDAAIGGQLLQLADDGVTWEQLAFTVRVPAYACSDTCNNTCIALSGHVQRHLYIDLLGLSAWSLLSSVAGIAGHQYDAVF